MAKEFEKTTIFPKNTLLINQHTPPQVPRVAVVPLPSPRVVQLETVTSPISNTKEKSNIVPTSPLIMEKVWKKLEAKKSMDTAKNENSHYTSNWQKRHLRQN